jgi:hypothetical protein
MAAAGCTMTTTENMNIVTCTIPIYYNLYIFRPTANCNHPAPLLALLAAPHSYFPYFQPTDRPINQHMHIAHAWMDRWMCNVIRFTIHTQSHVHARNPYFFILHPYVQCIHNSHKTHQYSLVREQEEQKNECVNVIVKCVCIGVYVTGNV